MHSSQTTQNDRSPRDRAPGYTAAPARPLSDTARRRMRFRRSQSECAFDSRAHRLPKVPLRFQTLSGAGRRPQGTMGAVCTRQSTRPTMTMTTPCSQSARKQRHCTHLPPPWQDTPCHHTEVRPSRTVCVGACRYRTLPSTWTKRPTRRWCSRLGKVQPSTPSASMSRHTRRHRGRRQKRQCACGSSTPGRTSGCMCSMGQTRRARSRSDRRACCTAEIRALVLGTRRRRARRLGSDCVCVSANHRHSCSHTRPSHPMQTVGSRSRTEQRCRLRCPPAPGTRCRHPARRA